MARLVQQEAGINIKLKLVKKQKSAVDLLILTIILHPVAIRHPRPLSAIHVRHPSFLILTIILHPVAIRHPRPLSADYKVQLRSLSHQRIQILVGLADLCRCHDRRRRQ